MPDAFGLWRLCQCKRSGDSDDTARVGEERRDGLVGSVRSFRWNREVGGSILASSEVLQHGVHALGRLDERGVLVGDFEDVGVGIAFAFVVPSAVVRGWILRELVVGDWFGANVSLSFGGVGTFCVDRLNELGLIRGIVP